MRFLTISSIILSLISCGGTNTPSIVNCTPGQLGEPTQLRCAGLYTDWDTKTVSSDLHPFDPGLHLWSDGAQKQRWIYLPPNTQINTSDMNEWVFPVDTKFFKEFTVNGVKIETRMLWKRSSGWYRTTYKWLPDGSTVELTTGELNANGAGYEIPSRDECDECHNGQKDGVLGFSAVALASVNASGMTLAELEKEHLITQSPIAPIVIPGSALDVAALGFLHINCGMICHNPGNGFAQFTGFFMRLETGHLNIIQNTNTWITGVNQPIAIFAAPGVVVRIVPGNADASCVHYRMSHREGVNNTPAGIQMPPIDSHVVDQSAIDTISSWINQLPH